MRVNGQICCLRSDATGVWRGFLKGILLCGLLLLPRVSNAGLTMGLTGSALTTPAEIPIDLIVAVGIFVAVFMLRLGRFDRRQRVKQELPKDEHDHFWR